MDVKKVQPSTNNSARRTRWRRRKREEGREEMGRRRKRMRGREEGEE